MGTPPIPLRDTGGEGYKCASNILNSSIAVPRSFMGCCTQQNIEEVARSDGRVENSLSSAGLYWTFNPLARWTLPLYRYAAQGERAKMRFKYFKLLHYRAP